MISYDDKFQLIKRNIAEIVSEEELKELLAKKKNPVVYWGTAITGRPSLAYFFPLLKLSDFIRAGFKVKILLADLHGALDGTSWHILEHRHDYYKETISQILKALEVDLEKIEFVQGSKFQLGNEYTYDILKMASVCSVNDCKRAASEVVKLGENPMLGGLIYPIMQSLDEEYLKVDVQFGGLDQRKILMFARENLPKIEYNHRIEVMNPMIQGLIGKKMSSSDPKSKIDLTDDEKIISEKINKAYCLEGDPDCGIMEFLKYVIMTVKKDKGEAFHVHREDKFGGDISYNNYSEMEKDFIKKKLHPMDLKNAFADEVIKLLYKIDKKKLEKLSKKAYNEE